MTYLTRLPQQATYPRVSATPDARHWYIRHAAIVFHSYGASGASFMTIEEPRPISVFRGEAHPQIFVDVFTRERIEWGGDRRVNVTVRDAISVEIYLRDRERMDISLDQVDAILIQQATTASGALHYGVSKARKIAITDRPDIDSGRLLSQSWAV